MVDRIDLEEELEIMFEHREWVGPKYLDGIDHQRIAIVGHSHHRKEAEPDDINFTINVVNEAIKDNPTRFLNSICGYFYLLNSDFWSQVIFFNFIPECIGTVDGERDKRYDIGTAQQLEHGRVRAMRIIRQYKPHKVFVFSAAMWKQFPPAREENLNTLIEGLRYTWATYELEKHIAIVIGLRHTQGAGRRSMELAVQAALDIPCF